MKYEELKNMKKDIKQGLMAYMEKKDPGKSPSTYSTYVSDSNYLLNNDQEDAYIRFMRSEGDDMEIKALIRKILVEKRGEEKVKNGDDYYFEKLCWQREYIMSLGGIDAVAFRR